ncbi:MAG TPA: rRNA maturation RNase YbeY [Candidatus Wunengus sp. YC60]|uniref:rRNA maturation RNase YbeY n=1 Tax=Candidatus Wunengus sp. YC60 TaxID=3367697 RepID=UPI004025EE9E
MKLEIINLQKLYPVDKKKIRKIVRSVLKFEKQDAELNIVFTDNKRIKEINKTFLGHNYATDVITFAYREIHQKKVKKPSEKKLSLHGNTITGEIIISVEMAENLAQKHDCAVEGEIALYLVHGLLHLFGYDDKQRKDAKKMHQREGELLSDLGFCVPVPH